MATTANNNVKTEGAKQELYTAVTMTYCSDNDENGSRNTDNDEDN